ncbi:phosphate ABC transporter permease subunit PstC [Limimaricola pyoseonensis]|uniref:Phosphate transport system permease protein n=1 Tax=Limimaricola pyoseonensis TaxID=521013 RepID=A0A1G7AE66_9RHOB|nr:phosphate ABC transporter permease subunit PstC [Limimaricola pyoseonensis]SDE12156.1 phosphate ABC transporter membrane protein 1, PhoT family [Limimaricola pyoseonensis]
MPTLPIVLIVLAIAVAAYLLARSRAQRAAAREGRRLHSLPNYYGWTGALYAAGPALLLLAVWLVAQPVATRMAVWPVLEAEAAPNAQPALLMADVQRLAAGIDAAVASGRVPAAEAGDIPAEELRELMAGQGVALGSDVTPATRQAALRWRGLSAGGDLARTLAVIGLALVGAAFGVSRAKPDFRARNAVETAMRGTLIGAALLAILTTVGIVLALIFNTIEFFRLYPAAEFFFGSTWSPSFGGGSELGILPLLWGTLYISIIALLVAVPIGLFAAIYLAEYAHKNVRSWAKPMLEMLAGIPTIVYGLFALLTVGPLLVDLFGRNGALGVNWMQGGTAVMTAGLVMGIMLIPFVSSLSDDIINAVPQSLRDGSLGLGATRSETVRQVVLPAALPGIVGAVLLAASRAIGETMIVVLGAGAAARLSMNPFDAMTTVTAKIVSQLTGDADFSSPEALVAFALGMTLFVITLALNVVALWIVRRYREQYE